MAALPVSAARTDPPVASVPVAASHPPCYTPPDVWVVHHLLRTVAPYLARYVKAVGARDAIGSGSLDAMVGGGRCRRVCSSGEERNQ